MNIALISLHIIFIIVIIRKNQQPTAFEIAHLPLLLNFHLHSHHSCAILQKSHVSPSGISTGKLFGILNSFPRPLIHKLCPGLCPPPPRAVAQFTISPILTQHPRSSQVETSQPNTKYHSQKTKGCARVKVVARIVLTGAIIVLSEYYYTNLD